MEQINVKSAELPKLTISATITERKEVEKTITLPYYFKNAYGNLCKVVTPTHYLSVIDSPYSPFICANGVVYNKDVISTGTPIDADEFETAFERAITFLQMLNQDEASNEPDENVQIDQLLYDQR